MWLKFKTEFLNFLFIFSLVEFRYEFYEWTYIIMNCTRVNLFTGYIEGKIMLVK